MLGVIIIISYKCVLHTYRMMTCDYDKVLHYSRGIVFRLKKSVAVQVSWTRLMVPEMDHVRAQLVTLRNANMIVVEKILAHLPPMSNHLFKNNLTF
ncbi:hypothetical protein Y032_0329g2681 [Ancylostoma ceylanicum]|nr:hypothetical protein Y032_0329g2681 [Ancylostoma ceylanicum]